MKTVQTEEWYEHLVRRHLAWGIPEVDILIELEKELCPSPTRALTAGRIMAHLDARADAIVDELADREPETRREGSYRSTGA